MNITLILISLTAFSTTILGGVFAIRFKDKLHLVLGFSAGAVVGVAFFDLLPESIELGKSFFDLGTITTIVAFGFLFYLVLDRLFLSHGHSDGENKCTNERHRLTFGAGSLSFHSFLDGIAIGLAFHASVSAGLIVTLAVLIHDFSDGVNIVSIVLNRGGKKSTAVKWLLADAIAPVVGVMSTFLFPLQEKYLSLLLAVFCGFFLYIGASDLLPESHHQHPTLWTTFSTALGMSLIYIVIKLAGV